MIRGAVLTLLVMLLFVVPEHREVVLWICAGWVLFGLTYGSLLKLAGWHSVMYDSKGVQKWPKPK